jgi:hypothetical protein
MAKVTPIQSSPPWPGLAELKNVTEHIVLELVFARID